MKFTKAEKQLLEDAGFVVENDWTGSTATFTEGGAGPFRVRKQRAGEFTLAVKEGGSWVFPLGYTGMSLGRTIMTAGAEAAEAGWGRVNK